MLYNINKANKLSKEIKLKISYILINIKLFSNIKRLTLIYFNNI